MVPENRVLRRIPEPKTEEVVGGWRRQHIEELHSVYASQKVKEDNGMKYVARIG
jgi:hypothetical protein